MKRDMWHCSDERLQSLLSGDVDREAEQRSAHHLDGCPDCQARLEVLAAEPEAWQDARASLLTYGSSSDGRLDELAAGGQAFRRWHGNQAAWNETLARQLLAPTPHPEMLGRIGRYDVERVIGTGGMGVVFKAFDTELNRPVAIKVLAPYLAGSGAARRRFAREARAAAAVVDEHVVAIHNVEIEGDAPFLVMQFVAGESLQSRLDRTGPLEVCEILRIGMQTAAGLSAAHAQGLIHRDVKPSNILLEQKVDRALLTDFGLARAADDATLTRTGYHPGTPEYMSPEQARGESVDLRSDLFSLGSVLYAMCTGRPAFRAESSYGTLRRITDDEPRPIRELNPDIPEWLCRVIARLMAKCPAERWTSAEEVRALLADCLAHLQQPTAVPLPAKCLALSEARSHTRSRRFPFLRSLSVSSMAIAAACSLPLVLAAILIVLELGKGKLTIRSEVDDVPVRVLRGQEVVEELTVTSAGASLRVAAGQYIVEIDGNMDGITVDQGNVTLTRRGHQVVRIVKTAGGALVDPSPGEPAILRQAVPDAATSPKAPAGQRTVSYRGVCVRSEDGRAIHGAVVRFYLRRLTSPHYFLWQMESTDADGRFVIGGTLDEDTRVDLARSRIAVSAPQRASRVVFWQDASSETRLELSSAAEIRGRVTDADARPIAGASVRVGSAHLPGVHDALTDADGQYRIADVQPAEELTFGMTNVLVVAHPNYQSQTATFSSVPATVDVALGVRRPDSQRQPDDLLDPASSDAADMKRSDAKQANLFVQQPLGAKLTFGGDPNLGEFFVPIPGRISLPAELVLHATLSDLEDRPELKLPVTVEFVAVTVRARAYLEQDVVPLTVSREDIEQAVSGNLVIKVLYLPYGDASEVAVRGVEALVSTRLDPGLDPLTIARQHGELLAVVRLGDSLSSIAGETNK